MGKVLLFMRDACSQIKAPGEEAHSKLVEWGLRIRETFDIKNLHLTARRGHGDLEQVIHAIQQLGSSTASLHTRLSDAAMRLIRMEESLGAIHGLLRDLAAERAVSGAGASVGVGASPGARASSGARANLGAHTPAPPNSGDPTAVPHAAAVANAINNAAVAAASAGPAAGPLVPSSTAAVETNQFANYTLKDLLSGQLYWDYIDNKCAIPAIDGDKDFKRKADAKIVIDAYDAMATEMEKKTLKSPDISKPEKAAVIRQLTKLLIVYIRAALGEEAKNFGEGSVKVSSVVDAVRKAKRTSGLIISSQGVQQWRSSKAGAMLPTLPGESAALGKRPAAAPPSGLPGRKSPRVEQSGSRAYGNESDDEDCSESDDEDGGESAPEA